MSIAIEKPELNFAPPFKPDTRNYSFTKRGPGRKHRVGPGRRAKPTLAVDPTKLRIPVVRALGSIAPTDHSLDRKQWKLTDMAYIERGGSFD